MHELSIALHLIDLATQAAKDDGATCVQQLRIRLGQLSGVDPTALQFSFELAAEGTICAGATLEMEVVPVNVYCSQCQKEQTLSDHCQLICPACGLPTPEIIAGRELELSALEVMGHAAAHS